MRGTVKQRFVAKFKRAAGDACWTWTGARDGMGYGHLKVSGRLVGAHRLAWLIARGPIPNNLWVLHRCDNPSCVRVSHLFLGTRSDNVRDMDRKGRRVAARGARHGSATKPERVARGERNGRSRLSQADVVDILQRHRFGASATELAEASNVSRSTIAHIVKGRHWRHVAAQTSARGASPRG